MNTTFYIFNVDGFDILKEMPWSHSTQITYQPVGRAIRICDNQSILRRYETTTVQNWIYEIPWNRFLASLHPRKIIGIHPEGQQLTGNNRHRAGGLPDCAQIDDSLFVRFKKQCERAVKTTADVWCLAQVIESSRSGIRLNSTLHPNSDESGYVVMLDI